ncbi:hypothetical protein QBZ16_000579 [Prototheca wickerhamii]|uniref:Protein kinase domain-containing protein n=1 Tax=Prototheca wickerhamii TaxID=3111 RepID=A0AAD9INE6_PROWI|nr:hypothetical protein QBZ16_000579 [Prototheca wickerhamii]
MALDALTQSITNWDEFSSANGYYWNSSTPTCLWKGITCSGAGRVVSLSLECNRCPVQAEGSLPAELTQLTAVQLLNFQGNAFNSSLPDEWGANQTFPALQALYLQNNQLSGSLPSTWGDPGAFESLTILRLDFNQLSGTIPGSWNSSSFPELQVLRLFNNQLSGPLPHTLAELRDLQILSLQQNALTGSLPAEWPFTSLRELYLSLGTLSASNTSLTGPLPDTWGTGSGLGSLARVAIQRNQLTGTIPASWSQLPSLTALTVRPGNDGLCAALPEGSSIQFCEEQWGSCTATDQTSAGNGSCVAPDPISTGGSSFPVAAVVAPVVSVVVLGALLALFFWWRRRRRRRQAAAAPGAKIDGDLESGARTGLGGGDRYLGAGGHPFDTEEGQRALTKPFADPLARSQTASLSSGPRNASLSGGRRGTSSLTLSLPPPDSGAGTLSPAVLSSSAVLSSGSSRALDLGVGFSDWEVFPHEIEIVKRPDGSAWKLGSGGFGTVFKALRNGVQPVAVKVVSPTSGDMRSTAIEDFTREISILKACRDVNIVQFVGASLTPDNTMLVTEYCEGGNLANNIAAGRVTWHRRGARIALDVAKALVFLHSRRIVHFDLKSPNILLSRDGTAKISDVGMAKILQRDYITGAVGTLAWAAPEMLWGERCTEKADIYSYGIVLWEICTGERPVRGQLRAVDVPGECPLAVQELILDCLETRPSHRPSAIQIIERLNAIEADRDAPVASSAPRRAASGGRSASAGPSGRSRSGEARGRARAPRAAAERPAWTA